MSDIDEKISRRNVMAKGEIIAFADLLERDARERLAAAEHVLGIARGVASRVRYLLSEDENVDGDRDQE